MTFLFEILNKRTFQLLTYMNKETKKQLDLGVVSTLTQNGIFNYLQAGMVADIAEAVQQSDFNSMKPFKDFRTDIDSKLAEEIVFEYLTRHNMTNTIQCIVSESNRKLVPKLQPSGNIKSKLDIDGDDNYLRNVLNEYNEKRDEIFDHYHNALIDQINERLTGIGQSSTPSKSRHKSSSSHRHHKHRAKGSESNQNDDADFD